MSGYNTIFGDVVIQTANQTYLSLALTANTTLVWPLENQPSTNVVADLIDVTPSASGFVITLPDARQGSLGATCVFNNISGSYTYVVKDASGGTILTAAVGTTWLVYLTSNGSAAGSWRTFQYGAQAASINLAAIAGSGIKAINTSLNQSVPISAKSSNYTLVDGDRAKAFIWTGAVGVLTLPSAPAVGTDWFTYVRNSGTSDISVTPPSGLIDGAASKTYSVGGSSIIVTDGTNYYSIGYGLGTGAGSFDYTTINIAGTGDYTITGIQLNRISYSLTGLLTGNRNLIVPASVQQYWINNQTTGAFTVTVKTAAGTGIAVTQGQSAILYCDGTNVVAGQSTGATLPVPIASGGTGATTAPAALTNLGGTATGTAVFMAASASAARTTLGSGAVGDAIFVSATASIALTAMSGGTGTGTYSLLASTTTSIPLLVLGQIAGQAAINFTVGGNSKGYVGSVGNTNQLVTGSAANDFVVRSESAKVLFTANGGTSIQGYLNGATGQWNFYEPLSATTETAATSASSNFVGTISGAGAINTPTGTIYWYRNGNQMTLLAGADLANVSVGTTVSLSGLPVICRPARKVSVPCSYIAYNGTNSSGSAVITAGGSAVALRLMYNDGVDPSADMPLNSLGQTGIYQGWCITYPIS